MKEKLHINPDVLKWARISLGLSLEDAAKMIGKSVTAERLESWENGAASPSYTQLEKLAHEIYKRPVAVFFFPTVPREADPKSEFRTLPDTVLDGLPSEIVKLYRKAKLFQINLGELFAGEKPLPVSIVDLFAVNGRKLDRSTTRDVRKALGISLEEQFAWRSTETAFKRWREALEKKGVFVFKDAFKNDEYSGFCLYDEKYPLIFANNSMPDSRQVFTLFHELGHLLFHSGGIDFRSQNVLQVLRGRFHNVEVACNRFANELLVPQDRFDKLNLKVSEDNIKEIAEQFSVSREVILRKYLDRGLISSDYYEELASKWAAQTGKMGKAGGNYYYTQKAYLGESYINMVYQKYYQDRISPETAAEYLNIKPKNFPTFEHVVMEGGKL
jgi:Zn-dependent peptidase ImmA (M78 family)